MLISELLSRQKNNNKIAIKYRNKEISYCELYRKSETLSFSIINHINIENNNVAIFLPNSIDYVIAYFAITISKNIIVPIGVQSKPTEIINTIDYCEIDLIVTSYAYREIVCKCLENYSFTVAVLFVEDGTIEKFNIDKYQKSKSDSSIDCDDSDKVVIMLHTSGTTSKPKRVMLTHKNLICNIESNIASLNLSAKDITLISMPMYFGYCNTAQLLTHIYLGASIIILDGLFWPKRFFEIIQKEKVTNFTGVPSMLLMLLDYRYANSYDITCLRYICFGGGNMPVDKLKLLIEKFKTVGFVQTYGQTEASPRLTALLPEDSVTKIGSVGKPISNVSIKIYNENDQEVENNIIGEIVAKGPNIMKGYYKRPEITKQVLKSGWLHTGDLGYIDDAGYLYISGRKKNIIISGGINIYPEEIEQILLGHPDIKEVSVTAETHSILGDIPIARVVLKEGHCVNSDELRIFCLNNLSDFKVPKKFEFVDNLDKTYNGKIKKWG